MTDRMPWPRRHFYSPIVYSYPKPGFASAWCQCFAMRMVINSTRYKVLELCRMDPVVELTYEQQQHECSIRLGTMADNLAYSIPFCLERAKVHEHLTSQPSVILNTSKEIKPYLARLVIWPILIASTTEQVGAMQRQWFRQELASLRIVIGDSVFDCAGDSY